MGIGDQLMATGLARGAKARGKRIAFGDRRITWDHNSPAIFYNNPNIAPPGSEGAPDLEWINYCRGHRIYNSGGKDHWIWNYDFHAIPGEVFFDVAEMALGKRCGHGFVLIEPNVEWWKPCAPN